MSRSSRLALIVAGSIAIASPAFAQSNDINGSVSVTGVVVPVCVIGTIPAGAGVFDLGVLIDTTTGLLRPNISVPPKILTGSYCTAQSTISIEATPMVAHSSPAAPTGYSNSVDYTATASGWTVSPASYSTGASSNPNASQTRPTPFTGDIEILLTDFTTTGGNSLPLVGDPLYQGVVTVTITVAS